MRKEKIAETIAGDAITVEVPKDDVAVEVPEIAIRYMDRPQVKELRKAGLDPAFTVLDAEKTAEFVDWIIDNIYTGVDFVGVPYYKVSILAMDTYRLSMGGPEAIKNS